MPHKVIIGCKDEDDANWEDIEKDVEIRAEQKDHELAVFNWKNHFASRKPSKS